MDLQILNIYDHEGPTERVTFIVKADTNLNQFLVLDNTYDSKGNLSNKQRHVFWFPSQIVKFNEWVRLFTGKGTYNSTKEIRGGSLKTIHNFYWNLDNSVWNKDGDEAFLMQSSEVDKHIVQKKSNK